MRSSMLLTTELRMRLRLSTISTAQLNSCVNATILTYFARGNGMICVFLVSVVFFEKVPLWAENTSSLEKFCEAH